VEHALTRRAATGVARGVRRIDPIAPLVVLALVAGLTREAGARETWGPFQGQVVDVETEQPIAGAVILLAWWEVCGIFGQECFVVNVERVGLGLGPRSVAPDQKG
jgi:hypothetical protein